MDTLEGLQHIKNVSPSIMMGGLILRRHGSYIARSSLKSQVGVPF